jgi:hypothetical protein
MIATVACGLLAVACAVAVTLDACTRPPRIDPAAVLDEFARLTVALPVPPYVDDPVEAAAWSYDVDRDTYLTLARRT